MHVHWLRMSHVLVSLGVYSPLTLRRSIWGSGQDQCATIKRQLLAYVPGLAVFLDGMAHTNLNAIGQHKLVTDALGTVSVHSGRP